MSSICCNQILNVNYDSNMIWNEVYVLILFLITPVDLLAVPADCKVSTASKS